MNIFCKETQEHLDLHPNPSESEPKRPAFSSAEDSALITPELWMNNHEDSPPSSDTPSPPLLRNYVPRPSILNGNPPESRKIKNIRAKKKSKLLESEDLQMKFKKMSHPSVPIYRSPFPTPAMNSMFDLPAFRNPPPLLRILRPSIPPQPSPVNFLPPRPPPIPNPITQALPPPTTLVPYPVIVPLPIPVPIMIPLPIKPEDFYRILNGRKEDETNDVQVQNEVDTNDCQTNKPMKKRKKVTSLLYGTSSISEKPKDTIVIQTDEKDDMSSNKVAVVGNQNNNKKPCKDNSH